MISPDLRFRVSNWLCSRNQPTTRPRQPGRTPRRTHPSRCRSLGRFAFTSRDVPRRDDTSRRVSAQSRAHSLKECSDRRAPGETESAICVQRLDDSLNSAIHTRYRSLLRSSSMHEPRGPPLEVVLFQINKPKQTEKVLKKKLMIGGAGRRVAPALTSTTTWLTPSPAPTNSGTGTEQFTGDGRKTPTGNDPSTGSPTETLLRLLLPLNDQV